MDPKKLARLSSLTDRINAAVAGPPNPGEPCPACERPMPATPLELWMEQHGESFETLADALTERQDVQRCLIRHRRPRDRRRLSKNIVWRLNHQAPGWTPQPLSIAAVVLPAMLEITGLLVEELQNEKPNSPGVYACGGRKRKR